MDVYDAPTAVGGATIAPPTESGSSVEPVTSTQEISAAQVRAHITPTPLGAAAADQPPQIPLAPIKRVQARFNPLADGMIYLVVFLGGMLGTSMRYGLSLLLPATASSSGFWQAFHIPTFIANMIACFIFAMMTSYISQASWIHKRVRQLTSRGVGMGMCGGFSTLSALAIEVLTTLQANQIAGALVYLLVSFAGGLLVAYVGARAGLRVASKRAAKVAAETLRHHHRHVAAGETIIVGPDPLSPGGVQAVSLTTPAPPEGDFGQPQQSAASASSSTLPVLPSEHDVLDQPPAYEPAPITDEIPLTGDPTTGEVRG
ncbi:fluoride efflux transporter FluC [Bifidobacterium oedipodis]|uniref:Fluoride-specific ion channel FluC n=1 Tax=Bifidobacterium oedipodis TaxID=2675322 RepID=A0A7Y0EN86_9BIFI|nr:CrcB family protein [Bifidobacterium sp. DSM 109957]NMM93351.1 family protein CrcB [Bifidobacterium sp. DSM 109957]